jgi:ABC-type Mn2+/Zn2+ transport system permease subunit
MKMLRTVAAISIMVISAFVGIYIGGAFNDSVGGAIACILISGIACIIYNIDNNGKSE